MRAVLPVIFAVCGGCAMVPPSTVAGLNTVVPVEVLTGADDGLTQRLADALRSELGSSTHFTLKLAPTSDPLRVVIPTNVAWRDVSGKTRVTYRVRLKWTGHTPSEIDGVCWEQDLRVCAGQVVKAAIGAVRR